MDVKKDIYQNALMKVNEMVDTEKLEMKESNKSRIIAQIMEIAEMQMDSDECESYEFAIMGMTNKELDDEYHGMVGEFVLSDTEADEEDTIAWSICRHKNAAWATLVVLDGKQLVVNCYECGALGKILVEVDDIIWNTIG